MSRVFCFSLSPRRDESVVISQAPLLPLPSEEKRPSAMLQLLFPASIIQPLSVAARRKRASSANTPEIWTDRQACRRNTRFGRIALVGKEKKERSKKQKNKIKKKPSLSWRTDECRVGSLGLNRGQKSSSNCLQIHGARGKNSGGPTRMYKEVRLVQRLRESRS